MAKIMTVASISTRTKATASDDKYNYDVEYSVTDSGKTLEQVNVSVKGKDGAYAGNMSLNGSNKSISGLETTDTTALSTMLDNIVTEIKSGLTA